MKRYFLLLCLLPAGCDRPDSGSSGDAAGATSSREARQVSRPAEDEATSRRRGQEAAASRDPEIQKFIASIEAGLHERDVSPYEGMARRYAEHYPEAGITWLLTLGEGRTRDKAWETYAWAIHHQDPEKSFQMLQQLTGTDAYWLYAKGLARVEEVNLERVWQALPPPDPAHANEMLAVQTALIGTQASADPAGAWRLMEEKIVPPLSAETFLDSLGYLNESVPFPVHLFDQVPPDRLHFVIHNAIISCGDEASLAPIAAYIDAAPEDKVGDLYQWMRGWYGRRDNEAALEHWKKKNDDWQAAQARRRNGGE